MLLRADEESRRFFAPRAVRRHSRVGDEALRAVLEVVVEQEKRELQVVSRWSLVRVAPEDADDALPSPYARTGS
jgi:hypothetical protein